MHSENFLACLHVETSSFRLLSETMSVLHIIIFFPQAEITFLCDAAICRRLFYPVPGYAVAGVLIFEVPNMFAQFC